MFPVETQEVGDGDGLLRQAGEGLHHVVPVQTQEEVVPRLCAAGQDFSALLRTRRGGLVYNERIYWKYKRSYGKSLKMSLPVGLTTALLQEAEEGVW